MVHYTFQHMSISAKLSQNVIQYYKNITLIIGENTKRFTYMNSTKDAPELQKENSRAAQEGLEG